MKATKQILLITMVALTLVGCGKDGTGTGNGKITAIFSDSAVTSFSQTSGLAKVDNSVINTIIPSAYAVDGNISCLSGEAVTFEVAALGTALFDINTTCTNVSAMDTAIRVGLLGSMNSLKMRRTVSEAGYNTTSAILDFSAKDVFDASGHTMPRVGGAGCVETYTFNRASGTVTVSAVNQGGGCTIAYSETVAFRFNNGYLEFDLSNTKNFSPTNTYNDEGSQVPSYERFEVCGGSKSNDTLSVTALSNYRDAVTLTGGNIDCI